MGIACPGFRDIATFKNSQFSLSEHGLHGHQKNLVDRNRLKKFMQVGVNVACTPILVGVAFFILEILLLSKTAKFPFPTMDYSLKIYASRG